MSEIRIPNLIQQLEMLHSSQSQQIAMSSQDASGDNNISSNSSLENNIDSFENRIRISYQDQVQSAQTENTQRNIILLESQNSEAIINPQISQFERERLRLEQQERQRNSPERRANRLQRNQQIKIGLKKGICYSIMQFFFNYSLWLYLICNLIVIINQFVNKSNRNFTLVFWTVTSILFIIIRLTQTCLIYQRETEDFSNLMNISPQSRSRITRRSRLNRLYPRRQLNRDQQIPIQIIQQAYSGVDVENQNNQMSEDESEFPSNIVNQEFTSDDQRVSVSIQQIWLQSFRQQMQSRGVNTNVSIIQSRPQPKIIKGLSKQEIKQFNQISYNQQQIDQLSDHDNICSICLEKYECDKKLIKLPCSHIYHNYCITKWLLQDCKCPLCRSVLTQSIV